MMQTTDISLRLLDKLSKALTRVLELTEYFYKIPAPVTATRMALALTSQATEIPFFKPFVLLSDSRWGVEAYLTSAS